DDNQRPLPAVGPIAATDPPAFQVPMRQFLLEPRLDLGVVVRAFLLGLVHCVYLRKFPPAIACSARVPILSKTVWRKNTGEKTVGRRSCSERGERHRHGAGAAAFGFSRSERRFGPALCERRAGDRRTRDPDPHLLGCFVSCGGGRADTRLAAYRDDAAAPAP